MKEPALAVVLTADVWRLIERALELYANVPLSVVAAGFFDEFRESHFKAPYESRNTLASKAKGVCYCDYFPSMVSEAIAAARKNVNALPRLHA
jgi:hypothetical protein